ncbi:hypothetical protein V1264_003504 [Littorina saxatilis]|uniref:C-type lectin domain-containing protein n=1 Tax=Littorina saxatilis TaxID=31220 RepID=A0AAN9B8Z1_9CAEN
MQVFGWATGGTINSSDILPLDDTAKAPDSVLLVRLNNSTMKLQPQNRASRHFFLCEGSPAPNQNRAASPNPTSLTWTMLGDIKRFAFSDDKKTFLEAKKACAAQPGSVRLAVLDILFQDVSDEVWLQNSKTAADLEYWVDAVGAFDDEQTFLWGDGKNIDPKVWGKEKPDDNALVARLIVEHNVTVLAPTNSSSVEKRYICEEVPDIVLEWRQLGTPPKLFGFSRTASWGLQWAKEACLRQSGDVTLARLDTHLDDVIQVVRNSNFDMAGDTIEFWVDGTLKKKGETLIHWGNGVEVTVNSSRWLPEVPSSNDTNVIVRTKNGETAIAGFDNLVAPFKYICEGIPANTLNEQIQLSPPCTKDDPTTATSTSKFTTSVSVATSGRKTPSSDLFPTTEEANPVPVNDTATNENLSSTSASDSHSSTLHSYSGLLENYATLTALTPSLDVSTKGAGKTMQSAVTSAAEEPSLRVTSEVKQTPLLPPSQTSSETSFTQNNDAETQSSFTTQNSQGENTATEMRPIDQTSSVAAVTSVEQTNSFNSRREYFSCSCHCGFAKYLNGNISTEQKITNIQDNLLLNKKTLSSSKRRLKSASDDRPTAQAVGGCGIVIIVCVVCFIVAPDIASVVFFIVRKMKRESEKEIDAQSDCDCFQDGTV